MNNFRSATRVQGTEVAKCSRDSFSKTVNDISKIEILIEIYMSKAFISRLTTFNRLTRSIFNLLLIFTVVRKVLGIIKMFA